MAGAASLRRAWSAVGHDGYFSIPRDNLSAGRLSSDAGTADNPA